ncbi:Ycf48-like protein [compost metagenome]
MGNASKIARSTDNGASWALLSTPFSSTNVQAVATDKAGNWVAVGENGKIARSTDNGATWALVSVTNYGNLSSVDTNATAWVVGAAGGTLIRSTDAGATWTEVTGDFGLTQVDDVAFGEDEWIAVQPARALRSDATYPYDVSTGFKVPDITAPAGAACYVKAVA